MSDSPEPIVVIENTEQAAALAKDERKFLHDLASPLATLNLLLETTIAKVEAAGIPPDLIERIKKSRNQVEKLNTLLRDRRETLLKRSDPSST